jgi:HEAT repeat protein
MDKLENLLSILYSGDDERAEAVIPELAGYGEAAVEALGPGLQNPDADVRWWTVRAMAEIPHPQTPVLLLNAFEDEDIAVRQCAALGLQRQPHDQAISALIAALHSGDYLLSNLAGDALIAVGTPAVPALLDVMQDGVQASRLVAARALAMIGDHSAIPALFEALGEDSVMIEYWANEGLERMGVGMTFFKP